MIAAVFDTYVVVSGVLSPDGTPGKLLDAILDGRCQPVVSDSIMAEYEAVLCRPKFAFSSSKIHVLLDAISKRALYAPFSPVPKAHLLPDPDDGIFLAAAMGLNVPIVTGNLKHFPQKASGHIRILTPAAFLTGIRD